MNPTVRDARRTDAADIERVARASWCETYRDIFDEPTMEAFLQANDRTDAIAGAIERAASASDAHFLVAERDDGALVAFAQFGAGSRGPELFRIYADPDAFGTGAGSELLDELHRRISDQVTSYVADVHSRNERGRAFYDRKGFVIVGGGATADCDLTLRRSLHPARPGLPIDTDRLRIRSLVDEDLDRLHAIYGDAETMSFIGRSGRSTDGPEGTGRVLAWLRRHEALHGFGLWALDERSGEPLVGVAGLLWEDGHGPEVEAVYLVRRDRWGFGYASEALGAVLGVGHGQLGLARIIALAYQENDASRRVMEKAGMRPDGTVTAYGRLMTRHASES